MPSLIAGPAEDQFLVGSWFSIEIDKATITGITEVSGLAMEIDVVDYTQNTAAGQQLSKKRPGVVKYTELTIKRPLSADKALWDWAKSIRDGSPAFRSAGAVVLYNIANAEVGRWTFQNGWPSKWSASDLDVGTNDPMMEEVTLVVEMLAREK